ncbi:MAG: MltA domain-containing protein [Oligoflexia bacterium]|nr:MltA domain-containing protein [Oligoflexia bacterium]
MSRARFGWVLGLAFALTVLSCARAPLRGPENAMRRASPPHLADDLPIAPLLDAVDQEIRFLEKATEPRAFIFGERVLTHEEYLRGLRRFEQLGRSFPEPEAFFSAVREEFDFYEVYGQKGWGDVFLTSYYEPLIAGSDKPTERFSQPLYAAPEDLVALDLGLWDPKFAGERKLRGRMEGRTFVPYYSREQIDVRNVLKGRKLELCWVDPVDAFFLQIQGSGTVELPDGKRLRLNYSERNGHSYESISQFLKGAIPPERMNLHTIEVHLRGLPRAELQRYLNLNPSYVFFKSLEESALTYLGLPAVDGRTIATDQRYFPKGALGFLLFAKPKFDASDAIVPKASEPVSRFVLDQDIGGAIKGGGRVDLFWGRGAEAKLYAGAMKGRGRLYYLVPKGR